MSLETDPKIKFLVVGLMVSEEFQQCQHIVTKLSVYYPDEYEEPQIRALLNVDWEEHLLKLRRQYGKPLWKLKVPVAVFMNGSFFGDNSFLINYINTSYAFRLDEDFNEMGVKQLGEYLVKQKDLGRDFVYLFVAKDHTILGALLIMLYTDLVPETCNFFLGRCKRSMWNHSVLVRVVKTSWMQFKGLKQFKISMACENYAIPHDRRGVISMCNRKRHKDNSTNFFIALANTSWMDYKYVGFGQVIQGEEILTTLENLAANEEGVPESYVEIVRCDEFIINTRHPSIEPARLSSPTGEDSQRIAKVSVNIARKEESESDQDSVSTMNGEKYRDGFYCKETDLECYFPFLHLPDRLLEYLQDQEPTMEEISTPKSSISSTLSLSSLSSTRRVNRSKGFLARSKEDLRIISEMSLKIRRPSGSD